MTGEDVAVADRETVSLGGRNGEQAALVGPGGFAARLPRPRRDVRQITQQVGPGIRNKRSEPTVQKATRRRRGPNESPIAFHPNRGHRRRDPFSDLARAAYCPRQLYYARRADDRNVPGEARARIDLAFRYPTLVDASDATLRRLPIRRSPAAYRRNLSRLRERADYERLTDPEHERVFRSGKDCHGTVHKVFAAGTDSDPPVPTVVSPGEPPENGVWESQAVRAVAVAKAVAWEREREVPRALIEYPSVGTVREVQLTTRKKAAYRRALRAVHAIDGPPSRVDDDRCSACDYRDRCGTGRRSFRSLLG